MIPLFPILEKLKTLLYTFLPEMPQIICFDLPKANRSLINLKIHHLPYWNIIQYYYEWSD
jgi:hypothetical protein